MMMNVLKRCLARYWHPVDHNLRRITKANKDFARELDSKDIKFPVKIRDIPKVEKKRNFIAIRVFGYENKEKYAIYVPKQCCEEKMHHVLIKDFNMFMYDHLLYSGRKHFCFYCLQAFSGEEILKRHIQDYFKGTL